MPIDKAKLRAKRKASKETRTKDPKKGGVSAGSIRIEKRVQAFLRRCKELLDRLEELPEAADDFRCSVEEKVMEMRDWSEENKFVTEAMETAVRNMTRGVERWLE